jgi:divalent metal cation (Fe/Co/Zn/Cd) transporter
LVENISGVRRVSRVRVRNVGNQIFVDLTVDIPRHLTLEESHQVTQKAQEVIRDVTPEADIVVHTLPVSESEGVLETIRAVAAREHAAIHNVTVHFTERGAWISLDLEVDPHLNFESAHTLATRLEMSLRSELKMTGAFGKIADINVHIEPQRGDEVVHGEPLAGQKADLYIRRVQELARDLTGSESCHRIELHEIRDGVYLSFHLKLSAHISIAEVHSIAEDLENRLRREFPDLGRVVIHTDPI